MKKYVTIALFIFWAIVVAILVAGLLFYQQSGKPAGSAANQTGSSSTRLDEIQLAAHNTADNCWLLISGSVYDVTAYLPTHPGGADRMIPYCGVDATQAFATRGGGQSGHSAYARSLLADYYVGDFGQIDARPATSTATINPAAAAAQPKKPDVVKPTIVKPASTSLSTAELAKHNSAADCWLLIGGKIYNVTNYLGSHPGGVGAITPYCGRDATTAFATRGGNGSHSSFAQSLITNYYVGDLGQAVNQTQTQAAPANNQPAASSGNFWSDNESDDEYDD